MQTCIYVCSGWRYVIERTHFLLLYKIGPVELGSVNAVFVRHLFIQIFQDIIFIAIVSVDFFQRASQLLQHITASL